MFLAVTDIFHCPVVFTKIFFFQTVLFGQAETYPDKLKGFLRKVTV